MASIASFSIVRQQPNLPLLSLNYAPSFEGKMRALSIATAPLEEKVRRFFEEQKDLLACIERTPELKTCEELQLPADEERDYIDIKSLMQNTHTIPLSSEEVFNLIAIWQFLKTLPTVAEHQDTPQRFKIEKFCSITLFGNDNLIIHLKKVKTKCVLGKGVSLTATRAIHISQDNLSLVTELTNYTRSYSAAEELANLRDNKDLLAFPLIPKYSYIGYSKGKEKIKECSIFPFHNFDFHRILRYHDSKPILSIETQWKMFCFAIKTLKVIHEKGLVHRDIKPQNCLISFSKTPDGTLDFNRFGLCDFECLTKESHVLDKWIGDPAYWPKPLKGTQKQPADIFALAKLCEDVFAKILYPPGKKDVFETDDKFIDNFFYYATLHNPSERPTIDIIFNETRKHLLQHHPEYTWTEEFLPVN